MEDKINRTKPRFQKFLSMLKAWGKAFKSVPMLGSVSYEIYLFLRYGEGERHIIAGGYAKGFKFIQSVQSSPSHLRGDYELGVQKVIAEELKPGDTFYDVGAHIGFFSLVAQGRVGNSGHIIAIEPSPRSALLIKRLLCANGIRNYHILKAAVSNAKGYADLEIGSSSDMFQLKGIPEKEHLRKNFDRHYMRVPTITLDEVASVFPPPQVIKIDIEGAELMALQGADRVLQQFKPTLVIEVHNEDVGVDRLKQAVSLYDLLDRYGYRYFNLEGQSISNRVYHHYLIAK